MIISKILHRMYLLGTHTGTKFLCNMLAVKFGTTWEYPALSSYLNFDSMLTLLLYTFKKNISTNLSLRFLNFILE